VSTVTDLTATHRGGQTFLVGTKNAGATGATLWSIRRSSSPITSSSDGTEIGVLNANSYRWLYDDSAKHNLTAGLIITDGGSPLASTKILAVITTYLGENGTWYYGAFPSDDPDAVTAGNTTSVAETYQATPGAIRISGPTTVGIHSVRHYKAWEDIRTWVTSEQGYYGHIFQTAEPQSGISAPFPLTQQLHSAGATQYFEPASGTSLDAYSGVVIQPADMDWSGFTEPYTGGAMAISRWFGRYSTSAGFYKSYTEDRVVRYTKMVRDNLTGDGHDFQVDFTRVYATGASNGSGAMHLISHYPDVFAAGATQVGWLDNVSFGNSPDADTKRVNSLEGLTLTNYLDMAYYAANSALRPIIYAFGSHDGTIPPNSYTPDLALFETYRQPFHAEWKDADHEGFSPMTANQWNHHIDGSGYLRFKLNEPYPAFGNASTSTTIPTFPGNFAGQRNGTLDWQSLLHPITGGAAIVDTVLTFGVSLISSSEATGVTTAIRNAQNFRPPVGSTLTWSTDEGQSGSGAVAADGTPYISGMRIPVSAMRLTVSYNTPRVAWLKN